MSAEKPLALTLGEPAGIGPDITLAAWTRRKELALPPFYLLGNRGFIEARAATLGLAVPTASVAVAEAVDAFAEALPIVDIGTPSISPNSLPAARRTHRVR
jgi:4-hydroxythreonine-4-phosphate dehydrogenase